MPNRGKFTIGFKVKVAKIIRETSGKFDGLNNKMDEVDVTGNNAKWLMCFPYLTNLELIHYLDHYSA